MRYDAVSQVSYGYLSPQEYLKIGLGHLCVAVRQCLTSIESCCQINFYNNIARIRDFIRILNSKHLWKRKVVFAVLAWFFISTLFLSHISLRSPILHTTLEDVLNNLVSDRDEAISFASLTV
jgi:hypothetical protein